MTRFWISYRLFIIIDQNKPFCLVDSDNYSYIIWIEGISLADESTPSMFLVFRINILWIGYQYDKLDSKIVIEIIETSDANNDTVLRLL